MIFEIKKYYDPKEVLGLAKSLTRSQHTNFWSFFSAWRIFATVEGEDIVVRKRATQPYAYALIRKKAGIWWGMSCSSTRSYLENEQKKYYRSEETLIVPVKVGLIVKREFKSLTEVDLGDD